MSKLINKTRLQEFATGLWTRIKDRYDGTFKGVTLDDRTLKFTKADGTTQTVDVELTNFAKYNEQTNFDGDVTVNDAELKNNLSVGTKSGTVNPSQRSLGARNLSSGLFTDGYVSKFRVYLESNSSQQQVAVHVWAIKKGTSKNNDRTARNKVHDGTQINVDSGNNKKWIDIPINDTFANDTYFIFRTGSSVNVEAISNVSGSNTEHVVNLVDTTPPSTADQALTWTGERTDITAYIEIFGRLGIKGLNEKLNQVEADGSQYVKVADTTDGAGAGSHSGKVLKLGDDGKIKKEVLPAIALNEFITIDSQDFNENALTGHKYQNGDVIFNSRTHKRYLCIDSDNDTFANRFIELNDKNGVVTSINSETGDVNLSVIEDGDVVKIKANQREIGTINAITQQEITEILATLS